MARESAIRVPLYDSFVNVTGSVALLGSFPDIGVTGSPWQVSNFFTTGTASATIETNGLRLFSGPGQAGAGNAIVESGESDGVLTLTTVLNSINGAFMGIAFRATSVELTDSFLFRHEDAFDRVNYTPPGGATQFFAFSISPSDVLDLRVDLDGPNILCTCINVTKGTTIEISDVSGVNQGETMHGVHERVVFGEGNADRLLNLLMVKRRRYRPRP